jgi:signal transduction histidine kinase
MARRGAGTYAPRVLLDRLRTNRLDASLAVALTVVGLLQVVVAPIAHRGVGEVYVVASTLPLAWRRTRPVEAALVASAAWLIPLEGYAILGYPVVLLQFYGLGRYGAPRTAVVLTAGWAVAAGVVGTLLGPEARFAVISAVLVVVAPVLAGRLARHLVQQNQALRELTEELRDERIKAEEAAADAERARIAQELHDVVGHELTLIAIQAEAASAALRMRPERAAEPVEAIRVTAHRTMSEMRAALDVLAPGGDEHGPGGLVELVDRARAGGIDTRFTVTGTPLPDRTPVALAVHRIVRECLTNAGRHAPGEPVTVRVDWAPDEVVVTASNLGSGRRTMPGRGLTGIRHRAELLGGTFHTETTDGTFHLRVRIPLGSVR